ncbi:MAG TPA: D-alanine--D-alanine ligase family protein [Polyangiales bacterium]|nr:D-alanine--D-alanine ligase family protein [Polyangiales bacterium]
MTPPEDRTPPRIRVAVLYGGRSTEHEISLQSAASVVANLDRSRYEIVPIHVDKAGAFHRHTLPELRPGQGTPVLPIDDAGKASLALAARGGQLFAADGGSGQLTAAEGGRVLTAADGGGVIDVVFPVMHGPLCEDGSTQGLLELADIPYVGSRVLGSAICMDKDVAKRLVRAEGVPVGPYLSLRSSDWHDRRSHWLQRIEADLGYPAFVKPATLGSSVGVSRATDRAALEIAIATAFEYDDKLLCEQAVDAREIEFAVLAAERDGAPPEVSLPGEIVPREGFYSFDNKYLDAEGAAVIVPADLDADTRERGRDLARRIFVALECEGLERIDFFLEKSSGEFYFNEVNTLPGFTSISMYPKAWEASGVSYRTLLDRLIQDAVRRHDRRSKLRRER